ARCAADPVGSVLPAPWRLARLAGTGLKRARDDAGPRGEPDGKIEVFQCLPAYRRGKSKEPPGVQVYRGVPASSNRDADHVALTIGNFDGVHRGHQAMLTRLVEAAEDLGLPPVVLTFDPHPREFFARDLAVLRAAARTFSVEAMTTVTVEEERVSSSAIRDALAKGELERAANMLGRPYAIVGRVAHGDKLGRNLGFPTANVPLRHKPALSGIFAVRVRGLGDAPRLGVASLGVRPTVKAGARPLLEVFVFDFDAAIYGRQIGR